MEKFAVIKGDDFRFDGSVKKFFRFIFLCQSLGTTASVGVIGCTIQYARQSDLDLLKVLHQSGKVELWNHSMYHNDLTTLSPASLEEEISTSQQAIENAVGVRPRAFGAPFNKINEQVLEAIRRHGIRYCYEEIFQKGQYKTPEHNVILDGQPNFEEFRKRVGEKVTRATIMVQVHPTRWTSEGFDEFEKCLKFLIDSGYRIRTLEQMAHREADRTLGEGHRESFETAVKLQEYWSANADRYESGLSNFRSYFLSRFIGNYLDIVDLMANMPITNEPTRIVDVGSGLGQWGMSGLVVESVEEIHLFDINKAICEALEDGKRETGADRLVIHNEDFLKTDAIESETADIIFCTNALNYISLQGFASKCEETARRGGYLIILNQTDAFNHIGLNDCMEAGNVDLAKERGLAILRTMLAKVGFAGYLGGRTTPDYKELQAVMHLKGFTLYDNFVPVWERRYKGQPTFQGYTFFRNLFTAADKQPAPRDRAYLRKLILACGCIGLDAEIFPKNDEDFESDKELKQMAVRAGRIKAGWLSFGYKKDARIAEHLASADHIGLTEYLLRESSLKPVYLLAGCASAAILNEPALYRKFHRKIETRHLDDNQQKLLATLGYLVENDIEEARLENRRGQ